MRERERGREREGERCPLQLQSCSRNRCVATPFELSVSAWPMTLLLCCQRVPGQIYVPHQSERALPPSLSLPLSLSLSLQKLNQYYFYFLLSRSLSCSQQCTLSFSYIFRFLSSCSLFFFSVSGNWLRQQPGSAACRHTHTHTHVYMYIYPPLSVLPAPLILYNFPAVFTLQETREFRVLCGSAGMWHVAWGIKMECRIYFLSIFYACFLLLCQFLL